MGWRCRFGRNSLRSMRWERPTSSGRTIQEGRRWGWTHWQDSRMWKGTVWRFHSGNSCLWGMLLERSTGRRRAVLQDKL